MFIRKTIFFFLCISLLITTHNCNPAEHFIDNVIEISISKPLHTLATFVLIQISLTCLLHHFFNNFTLPKFSLPNLYKIACYFYKSLTHTTIVANQNNINKTISLSSGIDHLIIEKQAKVEIIVDPSIEECSIQISGASNIIELVKTNKNNNCFTVNYGKYIIDKKNIPYYKIYLQKLNFLTLLDTTCIKITGLDKNSLSKQYLTELPPLTIILNNSILDTWSNNFHFDRSITLNTYGKSSCGTISTSQKIFINLYNKSSACLYGGCAVEANLYDRSSLSLKRYEEDYQQVQVKQHGFFTTLDKFIWE